MSNSNDKYVGEWRPHRPRGPIMAHYTSPGPKYMLPGSTGHPEHDVRKNRYPAYSFGARTKLIDGENSPGPIYKLEKYLTRHGNDGTPVYSLYPKIEPLRKFNVPGPGTYSPEKGGPQSRHMAPIYSLHDRTKLAKSSNSPGPAAYAVNKLLGTTAPLYSLTARRDAKEHFKSPGPAQYQVTTPDLYKNQNPLYSLTGRNHAPLGGSIAPGPGQHRPERYTETGRQSEKHSFGIRHSVYSGKGA